MKDEPQTLDAEEGLLLLKFARDALREKLGRQPPSGEAERLQSAFQTPPLQVRRGTFLPQVWGQLPNAEDFLGHLCLKAGLPRDAWKRSKLDVATYRVQRFDEPPG
jgi:AMMECR1 domain-containing protein